MYHPVRVVHIGLRGYRYADRPLSGDTRSIPSGNVQNLIITEAHRSVYASNFDCYRGVPIGMPQISIVTEEYWLVGLGIFGDFSVPFGRTAGMPRHIVGMLRYGLKLRTLLFSLLLHKQQNHPFCLTLNLVSYFLVEYNFRKPQSRRI